jgi:leader peptidase (prepilin peptidase)/N-methyltransferase
MPEGAIAGLFGLLIGSFLNVCIHRWPLELSVVRPRSRCPSCENPIGWYDNIPLLSWIVLRARCRRCGAAIPWRYPLVELLTGVFFFWFGSRLGLTPEALKYCVFAAILIGLVFSDLETLLLPDEFTVGGTLAGLAFSWFVPVPDGTFTLLAGLAGVRPGPRLGSFGGAVLGGIVPAGTLWLAGWLFEKLRHKEGLGFGDVKMLAMIGTFLGLSGALLTCFAGSVMGSVVGLIWIAAARKNASTFQLPLGSFLGAAALFNAAAGQNWYWALFG